MMSEASQLAVMSWSTAVMESAIIAAIKSVGYDSLKTEYLKALMFCGLYILQINGKHRFRKKYFRDMMKGWSGFFLEVSQSVCDAELCRSFGDWNHFIGGEACVWTSSHLSLTTLHCTVLGNQTQHFTIS